MGINYDHSQNLHTLQGPAVTLPVLFAKAKPTSLLDVGCGTGTWLKAATDFGIEDVYGLDGVAVPPEKLHVPADKIRHQVLKPRMEEPRRFDAVICLEVAEHLDSAAAPILIDALVQHGDRIYFSAACPGQPGQHHVNCQWPTYWQHLFNEQGYACEDDLRWQIWDDSRIEPWYRQNLFLARRAPEIAGREARLRSVVNPDIWRIFAEAPPSPTFRDLAVHIEQGRMPLLWYATIAIRALSAKLHHKFR